MEPKEKLNREIEIYLKEKQEAAPLFRLYADLFQLQERYAGQAKPPLVPATLTRSVASAQGRRDYLRVRLRALPSQHPARPQTDTALQPMYEAEPIMGASGLISGIAAADGLMVCPENREGYDAGDTVMVELFR